MPSTSRIYFSLVVLISLCSSMISSQCDLEGLKSFPTITAFLNSSCKIYFRHFPDPTVSIVMLSHNNPLATLKCVLSVAAQDFLTSAELIIVDDASSDKLVYPFLSRLVNVKIHYNKGTPLFYGSANNLAIREYASNSSKYILFLNNDLELKPHFFNSLYKDISTSPRTGVVGCKLIFMATGRLQEAGSMVITTII